MTTLAPDPFSVAADLLDPPKHPYAEDIPGWVRSKYGGFLTSDQRDICEAVTKNRYVAVRSCHETGKSFTASNIAAHWIDTHPPGEAFVLTTATRWSQVRVVLWRELARVHRNAQLRGRIIDGCEWKMTLGTGPDQPVAIGRKPADYDSDAFQGIHERYFLAIIDEAGGVPKALFTAIETLVANEYSHVLAIGNPDDPAAHFATICKPGSGWHVMELDALKSPNFTKTEVAKYPAVRSLMIQEGIKPSTEDIPDRLRPMLVSPLWVDERIKRWGITSPLFTSKVRGKFPKTTVDTLISPTAYLLAQERELQPEPTDSRFGVDVARYGPDHSIIALRQGGHVRIVVDIPKGPVTEVAGHVLALGRAMSYPAIANVDDAGVGGGVTDILIEEGYQVLPMISNGTPEEKLPNGRPRFYDSRSEWWWTLKEAIEGDSGTGEDGWLDLDPDDEDLAAQVLAIKYGINRHGQIWVEPKDKMKKRGLPSPDRGDAVVYCMVTQAVGTYLPERMVMRGIMEERW